MARRIRIKGVVAKFDGAGGLRTGTVTIDRDALIFSVRPLHRRHPYELPLATVVDMVCDRMVKATLAQKRAAKLAARKGRKKY